MKDKCPTCGSDVTVGGEGSTHFYVPVMDEKALELLEDCHTVLYLMNPDSKICKELRELIKKLIENGKKV
jgi:hypothetical protein